MAEQRVDRPPRLRRASDLELRGVSYLVLTPRTRCCSFHYPFFGTGVHAEWSIMPAAAA